MREFSRITGADPALQKVQDATARALREAKDSIAAAQAAADAAQAAADATSEAPSPMTATLTGDVTISSESWADVTGLSVTFTAVANERALVCVAGVLADTGGTATSYLTISVAGSDVASTYGLCRVSYLLAPAGIAYLTDALSAGSTTIKVRCKVTAGSGYSCIVRTGARLSVVRLGCSW